MLIEEIKKFNILIIYVWSLKKRKRLRKEKQKNLKEDWSAKKILKDFLGDKMLRVMLDTNVLVKLVFVLNKIYKNTRVPKNLKNFHFILNKMEKAKFINVMSSWNKLELRDVLMKLKLIEVYFLSGFSVDEFRDAKEEKVGLSSEDIKSINRLVFDIWKFCDRTDKIVNNLRVEHWTKKDYSSMDIILLNQAEQNKCDYFVTNDRKIFQSKELKKHFKVKICNVKEFKNKLEKQS